MSYRICTRCVMDTTDPQIHFDENGHCNHCTRALELLKCNYLPNAEGERRLQELLQQIKEAGKGKPYDCLLGVSGGVDSSWLTYKSKEWGLRPLVFHVDGGWNSEVAQQNIEKLLNYVQYDLYTHVVDWEEMRDLQRAYLKSGLANQDVPQDHIFIAGLLKKAVEMDIDYCLSGLNLVSESILPNAWEYDAKDGLQLRSIHNKFGKLKLKTYMPLSFYEYYRYYRNLLGLSTINRVAPLNYMPYSIEEVKRVLAEKVGWKDYGRKHGESRFTKFFQNYYLPTKFGYDKRIAHFSSLIVAGEISRDHALQELEKPLYDEMSLNEDKEFILKKLNFTHAEWDEIMALPNKSYKDYPNWEKRLKAVSYVLDRVHTIQSKLFSKG